MKRHLSTLLLLASVSIAQETAPPTGADAGKPAADVSGAYGIDFSTHYFFRGILQENQDVIAQPWLHFGYGLGDVCSEVKNLTITLGTWNSLHDGPTGSGGGQAMWYENDMYATLAASVAERWNVSATYTNYFSPNARFGTVQEFALGVAYDDHDQISAGFAGLQPSVQVAFELDGQADAGSERGTYAQLAVAPKFDAGKLGDTPISVSTPVTAGLGLSDYYEFGTGNDDFFGYLDVGVVASAPLSFMPSRLGPWDGYLGLHLMVLGDNNKLLNHDEGTQLVFSMGLSTTF